jgi:hypothetical protein
MLHESLSVKLFKTELPKLAKLSVKKPVLVVDFDALRYNDNMVMGLNAFTSLSQCFSTFFKSLNL